ncbi:MAG: hypothetical protein FJ148_09680 [Deltaproteobacteria bacterium]|nr:hypothetical protein [Deltaproteobacteria bacterium]
MNTSMWNGPSRATNIPWSSTCRRAAAGSASAVAAASLTRALPSFMAACLEVRHDRDRRGRAARSPRIGPDSAHRLVGDGVVGRFEIVALTTRAHERLAAILPERGVVGDAVLLDRIAAS